MKNPSYKNLIEIANQLYELGYSGVDLIKYFNKINNLNIDNKSEKILIFDKIKKDFRNEKIFILFILTFIFIRSNQSLENLSFM